MIDERERYERAFQQFEMPEPAWNRLNRRHDRKRRNQRVRAGALGLAIAIAVGWLGINAIRSTPPVPADPPDDRSGGLGIFEPVAGRIVYVNEEEVGDRGYDPGVWAVDPNGPSDTIEGPGVADDVAATLVRLDLEDAGSWSSDGTELLFVRTDGDSLFPRNTGYILHADGSETRLNAEAEGIAGADISPDGTRVVFGKAYEESGLFVVDAEGGRPVHLPLPVEAHGPTFSPDATRIAFLVDDDDGIGHVWVANVDGSDAHEVLAIEPAVFRGLTGLEWSPTGDRIAIGVGAAKGSDALAIYTFAPDGSDFTKVITGGVNPYWSPDGSQIAYTILCGERPSPSCPDGSILRSQFEAHPRRFGGEAAGLAIADADGSNVQEFGFAASGPWHPGV